MSDEQTSTESDLGPRPEPQIEPAEVNPGGADADGNGAATIGADDTEPQIPDPDPSHNPATNDAPAETREGEDTSTEATRGDGSTSDKDETPA